MTTREEVINFVSNILENSGFKIRKNLKVLGNRIDLYAQMSLSKLGKIKIIVLYRDWKVGIDFIKEIEMIKRYLKISKVIIIASSGFTQQAIRYAKAKNISIIDEESILSSKSELERNIADEIEDISPSYNSSRFRFPRKIKTKHVDLRKKPEKSSFKSLTQNLLFQVLIVYVAALTLMETIRWTKSVPKELLGVLRLLFCFIFSYTLSYATNRKTGFIRGTIIFFSSILLVFMTIIVLKH
ncbi:restriction endonuclease [Methanothermus fervidus DSM 2088]|uniref:Restriction endonuclease n=1 Tax=Methanothermus fervidus (strain ATCC 43054 / DSM 2088 / JCM 10308 / V24 S) TaxID=523846 RepID=E3GY72_METFV|nr:restriction endonuclease [Methanothermus fervidus]ADP77254.1 restriction endonuclease [Methanothermus fervidus DSM 2088]